MMIGLQKVIDVEIVLAIDQADARRDRGGAEAAVPQ